MTEKQNINREWWLKNVTEPIYKDWLEEMLKSGVLTVEQARAEYSFTPETPPDPSIIPEDINVDCSGNLSFADFQKILILNIYKISFGWRRFFYKCYWETKLGFKNG